MPTCEYCSGPTPATVAVTAHGPSGDTINRRLCERHLGQFLAMTGRYDVTITGANPSPEDYPGGHE